MKIPNKGNIPLFLASFFWTGFISKKMPGTVGSLFGSILLVSIPTNYIPISFLILFTVGLLACELFQRKNTGAIYRDPGFIVIDEVCGIFLGGTILVFINHTSIHDFIFNFILFRFFDILKPFPIKRLEDYLKKRVSTSVLGIMLDDILAAIYATLIQIICIKVFAVL
ncbi:MAG: phosphatidylglycerophosphatase A [Holosporales bacterium]|jgi:phosphatidylglycerophosphatase A|nr:phosphatidylglycerophosphatase A [Holosporales bacterium]